MDAVESIKLKLSRLFRSKIDTKLCRPIGVYEKQNRVYFLFQKKISPSIIESASSDNGFEFNLDEKSYEFNKNEAELLYINRFCKDESEFFYTKSTSDVTPHILKLEHAAVSHYASFSFTAHKGYVVSDYRFENQMVVYYGERNISTAFSSDLKKWKPHKKPLIIEAYPIEIGGVYKTDNGILILYFKKEIYNNITYYSAYLALFDKDEPLNCIWKTPQPVFRHKDHWKDLPIQYVGSVYLREKLVSYWYVNKTILYAVQLTGFPFDPFALYVSKKKLQLKKHPRNPILSPNPKHDWEAFNTFNPAALYADKKVHLLYRAQGYDYVSTVGYAVSTDGVRIDKRHEKPIYAPRMGFEENGKLNGVYDFMSGGSYGGVEDPRVTLMNDTVYMTYVAFDGWSPPRLALTSILLDDFLHARWNWEKPVLISPPGIIDKSGCLLPEKINGKYVFFHRVFPNILIDFVDDLNFDGKTKWLKGKYQIKIRENMWDSRKIGAGAPPIKTKDGWLLIYYGVDDRDASKYHIGAMLLDLKNPTQVLHRTNHPIVEPLEDYENNGFKPGIAYPCGAVIVKDTLMVYYGGSDSVVCVATAHLDTFLQELTTKETGHLDPIQIREVEI